MPHALCYEEVTFAYGSDTVLAGLDLDLAAGDRLLLVSLSGGGKTTILRLALGLRQPQSGHVRIDGRSLAEMDYDELQAFRRGTGYLLESHALMVNQRIFDNLALPLRYHHALGEDEIRRRVMGILEALDLASHAQEFPATLSMAELRQAAFARALVVEPGLLVMDDPFLGISPQALRRMQTLLSELRERRPCTLLWASQTVAHTTGLVDRIAVLKDGKIVKDAKVEEFTKTAIHRLSNTDSAMSQNVSVPPEAYP